MANQPEKLADANNKDAGEKAQETEEKPVVETVTSVEEEILNNIALIGRAVNTIEPRFTIRVLRTLTSLRKKLTKNTLKSVLDDAFPKGSKTGQTLIASPIFSSLPDSAPAATEKKSDAMEIDTSVPATEGIAAEAATGPSPKKKFVPPIDPATGDLLPEGIVYLRLLLILANLDAGRVVEAGDFAMETADLISSWNRRTMDQLAGKVWFYVARAYELQGRLVELQSQFLAIRQTAALRKDETLEVTVLNLLLRSYLANSQYEQAEKLVSKTQFHGAANQAQTVRWLFYTGRLRAIQLNYAEARNYLQTAIRRAPKDEVAPGFVQLIHKYFIIVVLLTGVIPDRALFRKPVLKQALAPYFQIVQAVRIGDVAGFQKAFQTHEATFFADSTHFLISRLRHFVIKTALRTITLAYSRISLADVCIKLHLDSEEDTEYIVAKAIKDGVIDATIDPQGGWMQSKVAKDLYETDEPAKQFQKRVQYCTQVYNESVRAMRYPPNAHRKELDSAAESRERDREIAQLIQESDEPDDMDDMGDL
ncbi:26S proteasome regulatory subunit N3 [Cryptococcus gattii E566]|uniref:26S proteasome regulatory subunit RPN3 n=2 Tax=Cryptococcus gattii TaxID=37769 RepID=E6QZU4_CRYGW|nr:26S proteasome regulatory subunit, putative [Cryptococcus gattii WM276]ADV20103.1 26S proteasome regulatory subunit, putative [Cryptococcus gattii WM276]KIR77406.1 26S proteasome regulatory subunit N3 [Cryptococcus gattii EJB2]KIY36428.1 26S proteasome regulatory subunit N3 [Cryptococcus gattii E566]KJE05921.1 26S proteasome regulatory subunit N3 [Cryptococcus gattii NT-10]